MKRFVASCPMWLSGGEHTFRNRDVVRLVQDYYRAGVNSFHDESDRSAHATRADVWFGRLDCPLGARVWGQEDAAAAAAAVSSMNKPAFWLLSRAFYAMLLPALRVILVPCV